MHLANEVSESECRLGPHTAQIVPAVLQIAWLTQRIPQQRKLFRRKPALLHGADIPS